MFGRRPRLLRKHWTDHAKEIGGMIKDLDWTTRGGAEDRARQDWAIRKAEHDRLQMQERQRHLMAMATRGMTPQRQALAHLNPQGFAAHQMGAPERADARAHRDKVFNANQTHRDRTYNNTVDRQKIQDKRYDSEIQYRDQRDATQDERYAAEQAESARRWNKTYEQNQPAPYQYLQLPNGQGVVKGNRQTGETEFISGYGGDSYYEPVPEPYFSPFENFTKTSAPGGEKANVPIVPGRAVKAGETVRIGGPAAAQTGAEVPAINGHVRTGNEYHPGMNQSLPSRMTRPRVANKGKPSPFDSALDTAAAKTAEEWFNGDQAVALQGIMELDSLIEELEEATKPGGDNLSGPYIGMMPDHVRQKGKHMKQRAHRVVQSTLKAVLGGQFTEKEAEQLFARTYDDSVQEYLNVEKLKVVRDEMVWRALQRDRSAAYGKTHGTMRGYTGHLPQFNEHLAGEREPNAPGGPTLQMYNEATATQQPVQIRTAEDYERLAPGTPFIDPDGNPGVKR